MGVCRTTLSCELIRFDELERPGPRLALTRVYQPQPRVAVDLASQLESPETRAGLCHQIQDFGLVENEWTGLSL